MSDFKNRLSEFYNTFNEDKRLAHRHGIVEYETTMKYLHEYLLPGDRIIDIGTGTGKYAIALHEEGYDVTAVEYLRTNIGKFKNRCKDIRIVEASAVDLHMFKDDEFDVAIMFGPLYHLYAKEDRIKAMNEARRIAKKYVFVTYIMNEYAVIEYAFKDGNYLNVKDKLDETFRIDDPDALFFQTRIEDIDELNKICGLTSIRRFASDGPSDYIRPYINKMDDETFKAYIAFHQQTCERKELLGASSHVVDILTKNRSN